MEDPNENPWALVRQCSCGMTTAVDMDDSPVRERDLAYPGQTVRRVPYSEAVRLWNEAGKCKCISPSVKQAWLDWLCTEGQPKADPTGLVSSHNVRADLENRLWSAFKAGAKAAR